MGKHVQRGPKRPVRTNLSSLNLFHQLMESTPTNPPKKGADHRSIIEAAWFSRARWKGRNTGAFKMDLLRRRFLPTIH